jgi:hypothetical protein
LAPSFEPKVTCRDPDIEVFVEALDPDDAAEDGLRQRDVGVGVHVGALATEVVGLLHADGHEKFLKI